MAGGRDVLCIMRIEEPAQFVKCALATLPKELVFEGMASELDDDEIERMIIELRTKLEPPKDAPLLIEAKADDSRVAVTAERD
jgi:hypothetical protein